MNKLTLKSIGAVLAGFLAVVVLSVGTDTVLEKLGVFPSFKEQYEHGMILAPFYFLFFRTPASFIPLNVTIVDCLRFPGGG